MARSGSRRRSPMARARRGPDHVVLVEMHAAAHHPPRLGLGHVVQQRGQLQHTPAVERAAEALTHVGGQLFAEGLERVELAEQAIGGVDRTQRVLEDTEAMRRRLGRAPHRRHLGQHHLQHAEAVRAPERATGRGQGQQRHELVAHPFGGDARQPWRRGPNGARRGRRQR